MEPAGATLSPVVPTSSQELVSIQEFPQIKCRRRLAVNFLQAFYAHITNNDFCFKAINKRYITALKHLSLPVLTPVGQRVVDDLATNGIAFANFSEFFASSFFTVMQNCFYTYQEEFNRRAVNKKLSQGKGSYLDTIHKSHTFVPDDPVSAYLSAPIFAAIAAHYMKMVPRFVGSSFWHTRVAVADADRIYSQQWHRDYNDRSLVKVFLYVTDVGPQEGYFEYLAGSHGGGIFGHLYDRIGLNGYRAYPATAKIEEFMRDIPIVKLDNLSKQRQSGEHAPWYNKPSRIQCIAPKATLIFADTFGLHRGGYVQAGYRDMIMTTYSTNFNIHKPHFAVTRDFTKDLDTFMQMSFGIV